MPFFFYLFIPLIFDWKVLKSEHFAVIYTVPVAWQARQTLQLAEIHKQYVDGLVGNSQARLPFVIEDLGMYANGYADPFMGHVHIYPYTPAALYSIEGTQNWLRTVTVHEYTHGAHLTYARNSARVFQTVFGSVFNPTMYSPGWLIEGLAVYSESNITPFEGRLNEGFYNSYIHSLHSKHDFPSLIEITNQPLTFPYDTYYLYGGAFFDYLAQRSGMKRFAEFTGRHATHIWSPIGVFFPCLSIDAAARHAYGQSFPRLYKEWRDAKLSGSCPAYVGTTRLTFDGWYIYALIGKDSLLYYMRSYSHKIDAFASVVQYEIVRYNPAAKQQRILKTVPSAATGPMHIYGNYLYYTIRELQTGMANRTYNCMGYVNTLNKIHLQTYTNETILTDRFRTFCVITEDSILLSMDEEKAFGSSIWVYNSSGLHYMCSTDLLIEEMLYVQGEVITISKAEFSNTDVYVFDLETGSFTPLLTSPWTEAFLQHGLHNRIGFTSNINGMHTLYELDLHTREVYQLSVNGYARNGVFLKHNEDGRYFIGLTADGFDIFVTHTIPVSCDTLWQTYPENPEQSLPEISMTQGSYSDIISTLFPRVRVPLIIPHDNNFQTWLYGALLIGQDATQENTYYTYCAYNSDTDDPYIRLKWQCRMFAPVLTEFYYETESLQYSASLPVYTRLHYGLHSASVFVTGHSFDDFTRKEIAPGIAWQFHYPDVVIRCAISLPYERIAWRSTLDRSGQFASISGQWTLQNSRVRSTITLFSDLNNPDSLNIQIRGADPLTALQGYVLRAEYSHCLLSIRWGLWNPNIYCEDLFAAFFFDYGRKSNNIDAYSIGIELRPEFKAGFGYIQFSPRIGCAYTHQNEISWFFRIVSHTTAPYLTFLDPF